jgi:hypothetical protein
MIVRELVTRLSFAFNRNNLDRFEQSVTSFKVRVAATTAAITFAVNKILNAFTELANENLSFKNIAEQAGIAASEFQALKGAAVDLGVSSENFTKGFSKLAQGLQQAKRGFGPIFEFFQKSGGKIRLPSALLSDSENLKNLFVDINGYLKDIPNQADRLYVLKDIFDPESASQWDRYFSHTLEEQQAALENNRLSTKEIENQNKLLLEYSNTVNKISKEWDSVYRQIATLILPVVNFLLERTNAIIKGLRQVFNHETGVFGFLKESITKPFPKRSTPALFAGAQGNNLNNNINTNIEINVPPGTTETQTQYMADSLTEAIEEMFQYKAREIMNNNPQVE